MGAQEERRAPRSGNVFSLVGGILVVVGWGLPLTLLLPSVSLLILLPPSHVAFFPWMGWPLAAYGVGMVIVGIAGRAGRIYSSISSSLILALGVVHIHQLILLPVATVWSYIDIGWSLALGVGWKVVTAIERRRR